MREQVLFLMKIPYGIYFIGKKPPLQSNDGFSCERVTKRSRREVIVSKSSVPLYVIVEIIQNLCLTIKKPHIITAELWIVFPFIYVEKIFSINNRTVKRIV